LETPPRNKSGNILLDVTLMGTILLGGIAFSMSVFLARFYSPERLPDIIYFQSTSVFLAFVVQAGLRAGLRNQYYQGRKRMVAITEGYIRRILPLLAFVLAALMMLQTAYPLFPAFGVFHALTTLLIGVRVAQSRKKEAIFYAVLTFATVMAGGLFVTFVDRPLVELRIYVEAASVAGILLLAIGQPALSKRGRRVFTRVVLSSIGLQLSSFLVYLAAFLLAQIVIALARQANAVAIAYADIQLLCGAQILVLSKLVMLYEGRLFREGKIRLMGVWLSAWIVLFTALVYLIVVVSCKDTYLALIYSVLAFAFLGRFPLAIVSQFVAPAYRRDIYLSALLINVGLLFTLYSGMSLGARLVMLTFLSPALASMLLLARSGLKGRNYFLRPVGR
jgi:hypothetical protein